MDRRSLVTLGACAVAAPAFAQVRPRWRTLFDGTSLDAWTMIGDADWTLGNGVVQADKGAGFLVSKETFGDVVIRTEIWVDKPANSGVFIRCTNPFRIELGNAYEVNVYDTRPDPAYGTGAIVDVAKVEPMPKAADRWNVMEIRAQGDRFDVWFNGARTVMGAQDKAHAHGRIALQYGAGVVKFRKVQVQTI